MPQCATPCKAGPENDAWGRAGQAQLQGPHEVSKRLAEKVGEQLSEQLATAGSADTRSTMVRTMRRSMESASCLPCRNQSHYSFFATITVGRGSAYAD